MSYSQYANTIKDNSNEFSNVSNSIAKIEIDSIWEGPAHDKQKSYLTSLEDAIATQMEQVDALTNALNLIDDYDKSAAKLTSYLDSRKNLNTKSDNYKARYSDLTNSINQEIQTKNALKNEIKNLLSSINVGYSEKVTRASATEVISTEDVFRSFESAIGNMNSNSFDLKNTVFAMSKLDGNSSNPNFNNYNAWQGQNPYSHSGLYGQCTWFAWGRFYEIYGFSPGFTGNGNQCANQLVNAHSDKFYISDTPVAGSVFSMGLGERYGHTGIVLEVDEANDRIVIQDGNYNGRSDNFAVAQSDWGTKVLSLSEFKRKRGGTIFANPINYV